MNPFNLQARCLPHISSRVATAAAALCLLLGAIPAQAQEPAADDTTVVYPADYFTEYAPVTAQDMLDRIPGLSVNRGGPGGGGPGGGNASRGGRGLGSGGNGTEILINGKRTAGKSNNSESQLERIASDQVNYIEIIRGTSGDLDVRGSTQIVNVVLFEQLSTTSLSYEANMDYYDDGEIKPGGSLAYGGQAGRLNFLVSAAAEPRYQNRSLSEYSILGDLSPNDYIEEERIRRQTTYTLSSNLDYQLSDRSSIRFNALYAENDNPEEVDRLTVDLRNSAFTPYYEREDIPGTQNNWEVGADWEYRFDNGHRFKLLGITNQNDSSSTRERFAVLDDGSEKKNLFLDSASVIEERILRGSYTLGLFDGQDLEIGMERAETTLESNLLLGVASSSGMPSADHGGLVPVSVTNANNTVEEIRYEPFAIHNWRINPRMSLETSLVYESSEISQWGDTSKSRDFSFFKPKIDYRYDITPSLQLRVLIEKVVRQLNFADFTASSDSEDNDTNTQLGNANLRPDYWWNYNVLAEYRLPNDMGVLSANAYKHRHYDFRQLIDISSSDNDLSSAWGNTGNGDMWVLDLNASVRMTMIDMPNLLITARSSLRDSEVKDPFTGDIHRFNSFSRGNLSLGFRHDIPRWRLNYGLNWNDQFDGNDKVWDIADIESSYTDPFAMAFVEMIAFGNITFRLDSRNVFDGEGCRDRTRYAGARSAGIVEEVEFMCSGSGRVVTLRMSGTF